MPNQANFSVQEFCVRLIYSGIWLLLLPFLLLKWLVNFTFYGRRVGVEYLSRFGFSFIPVEQNGFWLHCASVGEVVAAQQIVARLRQKYPKVSVTISTNTLTGRERVAMLFASSVSHVYLPYDFPLFTSLLLSKFKPRMVLITEMELWPNFCHSCWHKKIPVFVINGRMSEKSTASYKKLAWLISPLLRRLSGVAAQGARDVNNYLALGLNAEKIVLTNNIKFDLDISQHEYALGQQLVEQFSWQNRPIIVAGSTHEPEEQLVLDAYKMMLEFIPNLLLIIVPRHPKRFEHVATLITKQNLSVVRLSHEPKNDITTQVVLADKMGVLRSLYTLADVAFVGGSIAPRGGHNALEPAAVGVPIIMGRSIFNNPQICQTLEQAGALQYADDAQSLQQICVHWLQNKQVQQQAGLAAKQVIEQNKGAIEQTLNFLKL